jgi:hypothetical protein
MNNKKSLTDILGFVLIILISSIVSISIYVYSNDLIEDSKNNYEIKAMETHLQNLKDISLNIGRISGQKDYYNLKFNNGIFGFKNNIIYYSFHDENNLNSNEICLKGICHRISNGIYTIYVELPDFTFLNEVLVKPDTYTFVLDYKGGKNVFISIN